MHHLAMAQAETLPGRGLEGVVQIVPALPRVSQATRRLLRLASAVANG